MGDTRPPRGLQESSAGQQSGSPGIAGSPLDKKFGLGAILATDSTGVLYGTSKTLDGQKIAVNVLNPGASILSMSVVKIKHPNICETLRILKLPDGGIALVIQSPAGKNLTDLTESGVRFTVSQSISATLQLLSAIHAIHEKGETAFHLNANNIFLHLDDGNNLKLNLVNCGVGTAGLSLSAPHFLSPERLVNEDAGDKRADIWASGAILYHLLKGGPLFEGKDAKEIAAKNMLKDPVLDSASTGIPEELVSVLKRALDRDADKRFQNATDMVGDLLPLRKRFHEPMSADVDEALRKSAPPDSPFSSDPDAGEKKTVEKQAEPKGSGVPLAKPAPTPTPSRPKRKDGPARTLLGMPAMDLSSLSAKIMREQAAKSGQDQKPVPEKKPEPEQKPEPVKKTAQVKKPAPEKKPETKQKPEPVNGPAPVEPDPLDEGDIPTEILSADKLSYLMNRINDLADEEDAGAASEEENLAELSKRPTVAPVAKDEPGARETVPDFEGKTRPAPVAKMKAEPRPVTAPGVETQTHRSNSNEKLSHALKEAKETRRDLKSANLAKTGRASANARANAGKDEALPEAAFLPKDTPEPAPTKKPEEKQKSASSLVSYRKKDKKDKKDTKLKTKPNKPAQLTRIPKRDEASDKPKDEVKERSPLAKKLQRKEQKESKAKPEEKKRPLFTKKEKAGTTVSAPEPGPKRVSEKTAKKEAQKSVYKKTPRPSGDSPILPKRGGQPGEVKDQSHSRPQPSLETEKSHDTLKDKPGGKPPATQPSPPMVTLSDERKPGKAPADADDAKPTGLGTAAKPKTAGRAHTLEMRLPQMPAMQSKPASKGKPRFATTIGMPALTTVPARPPSVPLATPEDEAPGPPTPPPVSGDKEKRTAASPPPLEKAALPKPPVTKRDDSTEELTELEPIESIESIAPKSETNPERPVPFQQILLAKKKLIAGVGIPFLMGIVALGIWAFAGESESAIPGDNPPPLLLEEAAGAAGKPKQANASEKAVPAPATPDRQVSQTATKKPSPPESAKKTNEPTGKDSTPDTAQGASDKPAEITIQLLGVPSGAEVYVDGNPVKLPIVTPLGKKGIVVTVEHKGFRKWRRTVIPDRDRSLPVRMDLETKTGKKEPAGKPVQKSASEKKKNKKGSKSTLVSNPFL